MTEVHPALVEARRVLEAESGAILGLIPRLDRSFVDAVELIATSNGRVVTMGVGKSGSICRKISATLASTGTPSFFMHPTEAIHGDLGMLVRGDVVLAISNSGEGRHWIAPISPSRISDVFWVRKLRDEVGK